MESSRKGSESTITLKKLIIFVLLFFVGILTVIYIYGKMHKEEESDESGKTKKKVSGKSGESGKGSVFLEMDEKEVEEILNKAVSILNSGKEVKEKIVDFLNEYISGKKKKVSESMKKLLVAVVNLINKAEFKNLEDIRIILEVFLDITKLKY